jgi:hypothetical protein
MVELVDFNAKLNVQKVAKKKLLAECKGTLALEKRKTSARKIGEFD